MGLRGSSDFTVLAVLTHYDLSKEKFPLIAFLIPMHINGHVCNLIASCFP